MVLNIKHFDYMNKKYLTKKKGFVPVLRNEFVVEFRCLKLLSTEFTVSSLQDQTLWVAEFDKSYVNSHPAVCRSTCALLSICYTHYCSFFPPGVSDLSAATGERRAHLEVPAASVSPHYSEDRERRGKIA